MKKYVIIVFFVLFLPPISHSGSFYGHSGINLINGPSIGFDWKFNDLVYVSSSIDGLVYVLFDAKLVIGIQKEINQDILRFGIGYTRINGEYIADAPEQIFNGITSQIDLIHNWKESGVFFGLKLSPFLSYIQRTYSSDRSFHGGFGASLIFGG